MIHFHAIDHVRSSPGDTLAAMWARARMASTSGGAVRHPSRGR